MKAGTLMSVPFDAQRLELTGSPVAILDNVMQAIGAYNDGDDTGAGQFDVSKQRKFTDGKLSRASTGFSCRITALP